MFDPKHDDTIDAPALPAFAPASTPHWLALMLDEIDYGMLLTADDHVVLHANHAARLELDDEHPLQMIGAELRVRRCADKLPLHEAMSAARKRGVRQLVALGDGTQRITAAVVPLPAADGDETLTLLVLGKRRMCEGLSVHGFARQHRLTPAETRVLAALCEGRRPVDIAAAQHVAISTVRTQIGSLRAKTGAANIRGLVQQVAMLPPLVGALRVAGMVH
ncbi:MAG TPA: helix-turn-helix transcriptional regulator [Burkholderiaceae bacterium]|nr:helix-turn-helix transcriptional regulator [Burkholderiaceae bacterium]